MGEIVRVANAGYAPKFDMIEPFNDRRKGVILIDIDLLAKQEPDKRTNKSSDIEGLINEIAANKQERDWLMRESLKVASPQVKSTLRKRWNL